MSNDTRRTLAVDPLVFFHVAGESRGAKSLLKVEWPNGSTWQALDGEDPEHIAHIDVMKPGEHSDVKLRMKADSAAKNADAFALLAGGASDAYNPCVLGPMKRYDFKLLPAGSKTAPAGDAKPGLPGGTTTSGPVRQSPARVPLPRRRAARPSRPRGRRPRQPAPEATSPRRVRPRRWRRSP